MNWREEFDEKFHKRTALGFNGPYSVDEIKQFISKVEKQTRIEEKKKFLSKPRVFLADGREAIVINKDK